METLNIMNREDLTYFLFVNSKLNELLHREDLQKLAEEDNPIIILHGIIFGGTSELCQLNIFHPLSYPAEPNRHEPIIHDIPIRLPQYKLLIY